MEEEIIIPDAIDFTYSLESDNPEDIAKGLIEFAKLHVQAALKAAKKKTKKKIQFLNYEDELYKDEILNNTIIKSYPLKNIK